MDSLYLVKIADFGMSRELNEHEYYKMANMNKPLPMRWMAVESISSGVFTIQSDVVHDVCFTHVINSTNSIVDVFLPKNA